MYSDTLDMDFSFDVPVRRPALLSRKMFDVPGRPMDTKGLTFSVPQDVPNVIKKKVKVKFFDRNISYIA